MTEPREDWQVIATRAMATLDAIRAYVEPYHLAAITPTSGDVVPDDYQRGILHACDHVYQLATADPGPITVPATGAAPDDEPYRGDHGGTAHMEIASDVAGAWVTPRVIPGTGNPLGFRTPNRAGA